MAQVGLVQVLNWEDSVDPATEGPICLSPSERVRQWEDQANALQGRSSCSISVLQSMQRVATGRAIRRG